MGLKSIIHRSIYQSIVVINVITVIVYLVRFAVTVSDGVVSRHWFFSD